jgi:hypothetical protein
VAVVAVVVYLTFLLVATANLDIILFFPSK